MLRRAILEFWLFSEISVYFKSNLSDTYLFRMRKGMFVKNVSSITKGWAFFFFFLKLHLGKDIVELQIKLKLIKNVDVP